MKNSITLITAAFTLMFTFLSFSEVVVLFDEDEDTEAGNGDFVGVFSSHDAGSTVTISDDESISDDVSAFCTPSQSYNNAIGGWNYSIDKYQYMTFAWKKVDGTGIMIQFAHDTAWAYRYFSGENVTGWEGIQLENDIPEEWQVYTRDLHEDFGKGWSLTGIALTPWNGEGGYYDHILLHTEEDEGGIAQAVRPEEKLAAVWAELKQ